MKMEMEMEEPLAQSAVTSAVRSPHLPTWRGGAWRPWILPILLLILWQVVIAVGIFQRSQLPAPWDVVMAAREMIGRNELHIHIVASFVRVLQGFAVGAGIALVLGLLVGLSREAESFIAPTLQAIRAVPSLAWVPLLILWMGIDEAPKITLVAIGVFFPVYTNLVAGIRGIDRKLIEVGHAYGLSTLELVRHILLPAALPSLSTGLRIGLAQGWLFLVAAELIAASRGLGFLLIDSQNTGRSDIIVLSIVLLALIGKATDWLLQRLEQYLLRWRDAFKGA
ncbi:MAG: ABC transporter permease [Caldilineaceae bacterium]|nr:ABC transporter permease [Caldilineaceae bacterium]